MKEELIKLRAVLREAVDRLSLEEMKSDLKNNEKNLIIQYLEQASIEAGALMRDLDEN